MKTRKTLIIILVVASIGLIAAVVLFATKQTYTTFEFQVRDAVSKGWVWDVTVKLQGRTIRGYFQSDRGSTPFRFTRLKRGDYKLEISAPSYEPVTVQVNLKRGDNVLDEPIDLIAYEIPDLQRFFVFADYEGSDMIHELRPVDSNGRAITNHPCMNIKIAAAVSVQTRNGMPVQEETETGSERGELLFNGKIDWKWDGLPETLFRYSARIPGSEIRKSNAPLLVIDYVILIPYPNNITDEELESVLDESLSLEGFEQLRVFLDEVSRNRFSYYFYTSWNVPGGGL